MLGRVVCVPLVAAVVGATALEQAPAPKPAAGVWWTQLSPQEKQTWLGGFLAGAAVDSAAVPAERRFRFTPAVYAAQLDDYYWRTDHTDTPVVRALSTINQEMTTH
jgi:hypothetical protein